MKLERIQRRATKLILRTTDEYQERREKLNLLSFEQSRYLVDVLFLCKALNGHIDMNLTSYIQFLKNPIITGYEERVSVHLRKTMQERTL